MKFLRTLLDKPAPMFHKGGKLETFYPLYEAVDTFAFTPGEVTKSASHVRDALDLKRTMITVVAALTPCILMALFNTGLQANTALFNLGHVDSTGAMVDAQASLGWRIDLMLALGLTPDAGNIIANFFLGALYFFPIFLVCNIVGGLCEVVFCIIRRHEINEGFLVTGMLFPLTLPPTIPLWQVAVGIAFAVIIGKEIFGGTGKNILNPALTARVFLFFAYPAQITGDSIWVAADGYTAATPLGQAALGTPIQDTVSWTTAFLGNMPGSMGETSALACLMGAGVLIATGIGSWRIMLGCLVGMAGTSYLLNFIYWAGGASNTMFAIPFHWHLVIGSFAFATVFMATDPVSASMTNRGRYYYGALIGFMGILVRVVNPAYPEGWMLAILFANVFAPTIDYFVVQAHTKKRMMRYGLA